MKPLRLFAVHTRAAVRWCLALLVAAAILGGLMRDSLGAIGLAATSGAAESSAVSSVTLARPGSAIGGRLMLAFISVRDGASVNSLPSGWTLVTSASSGSSLWLGVYRRVSVDAEPASYTFGLSASTRAVGAVLAFDGVDSASPVEASAAAAFSSTSSPSTPAVTTTAANAVLVAAFAQDRGNLSMSPPTGMTEATDLTTSAGPNGTTLATAYATQAVAGGSGTKAATSTGNFAGIGALIALHAGAPTYAISGTVFEDLNYGGGAGRSKATSGGVGVGSARVELYGSTGAFVSSVSTASDGSYRFSGLLAGSYHVRLVSGSVPSSRSGWSASLKPVLTYRTDASSGSAVAVTDRVGGTDPSQADAGDGATGTTVDTASGVFSSGLSGPAQALSPVQVGSADVGGVDFGVNFATVVNVNDSGQGSLRQAITNANALGGDASLAVSGRTAGIEHLLFMIGNGSSAAGLRSGINLFSSGVAIITTASALPTLTTPMTIDAQRQPGWASTPVVELRGSAGPGLALGGGNSIVRGLAINGFSSAQVRIASSGNVLAGNHIGTDAAGSSDRSTSIGVEVSSGSGNTIGGTGNADANLVAYNDGAGIVVTGSATRVTLQRNATHSNGGLGIDLGNDGVSANTGSTGGSQPNLAMNHPVFTGAGVASNGAALTVYGFIGTGTGQPAFAGARVEIFKAASDATGYGEGRVYLGELTADANGQFTGTITITAGQLSPGDAVTATATESGGATSEFGPTWTSTTVAALTPAGFNAFDTATPAGSLTGVLGTRVAGSATSLDVIALSASGNALHPGFTGTVALSWLDARNDTGTVDGSCRSSWTSLGAAGNASFSGNARVSVSVTPPATSTRVMRLKMSYTPAGGGGATVACSNDAFAAIPASLTLSASDGDAATPGTTRALDNTSATGGVVHRAGRAFTVTAVARDANGATMTAYDGSPALSIAACVLPAGCSPGTLTAPSTSASGGIYTNSAVSYSEVGAVTLMLTDSQYADIDAADTAAASRRFASAATTVGRFVPDGYALAVASSGTLATANAACLATGSGATFFGQGTGWASPPQVSVTALNAAGGTTTLWAGSLAKLTTSSAVPTMATSAAGPATLSASYGSLGYSALGAGQARFTASATDRFVLELPGTTVQASTTPTWTWSLALTDASEAAVSGNPTLTASAQQTPVAFDQGAVFHSGRLALAPGHGDARAGVRQLVELQRWTPAGWVTMTEDRGCVTVQPRHLAVGSAEGVFATVGVCAAPMPGAVTTRGGRAWIALPATPDAAPGRLLTRLVADGAGTACTASGVTQPAVSLDLPWLTRGSGPTALATWGRAHREVAFRRETW